MAETLNLQNYDASGVYTIEQDASQSLSIPLVSGRLLIGTSRRGPINTVVLIKDPKSSKSVYGGRDIFLENKGSFFHKSLDIMLNEGPVYALNLLPIDMTDDDLTADPEVKNLDRAVYTVFNTESADLNYDSNVGQEGLLADGQPLKNYFNRQKFWYASDDELNRVKNRNIYPMVNNNILSIANLSKKQVTIFTKKADVRGYDVTVKEWFATLGEDVQIPPYLNADDLISDYMIDIIVVEGDWTNYAKLAKDPYFYKRFDTTGLKVSQVNNFMADASYGVNVLTKVTGCLIPDFQDTTGNVISIDKLFNNQYPVTEMISAIDGDILDNINPELPYTANVPTTQRIDMQGYGFEDNVNYIDDSTNVLIDVLSYRAPSTNLFTYKADALGYEIIFSTNGNGYTEAKVYDTSKLYSAITNGYIVNGDTSVDLAGGSPDPSRYIKISGPYLEEVAPNIDKYYYIINGYADAGFITETGLITWIDTLETMVLDNGADDFAKEFSLALFDTFEQIAPNKLSLTYNPSTIDETLLANVNKYIKVGGYLKAKVSGGRPRMLKILEVANTTISTSPVITKLTITTMAPQAITTEGIDIGSVSTPAIKAYYGIPNYITTIRGMFLNSFKVRNDILPGSNNWQEDTYKFMFDDTNLVSAITTGEPLDVRHMVDSYEGQISESSKHYIVNLGALHAKALVFVNSPSMKQFEKSVEPSFIDARTGLIQTSFIVEGGDLSLNPAWQYKLASGVVKGVPMESFAFYPIPNVMVREGAKTKAMIPAPYASNAWIRQNNSGDPFAIPAAKRGILTEPEIVGVEYDFSDEDRGLLEKAGYNLIVKRKNIGTMLYSNNTAYQRVNSALNNAHVRNALITIEKDIEVILFNFLFDWNDALVQLRVKTLAQNYLDNVVSARGLAGYTITMDDSNNTPYVLENNAGIIDITVDFKRGIHKFINRITITRVGGKLSATQSGFGIS